MPGLFVMANSTWSHIYKQLWNGFSKSKDLKGKKFIMLLTLASLPLVLYAILDASLHRWRALTNSPIRKELPAVNSSQCERDCACWKPRGWLCRSQLGHSGQVTVSPFLPSSPIKHGYNSPSSCSWNKYTWQKHFAYSPVNRPVERVATLNTRKPSAQLLPCHQPRTAITMGSHII